MASQNRKNRRVGIGAGAFLSLVLGTGSLAAMNPDGSRRPRIDVARRNALIALESAAGSFGDTDWSWIQEALLTAPDSSTNAETMFVFLSLGNEYLNRHELRRDFQGLSRSLDWFAPVSLLFVSEGALTYQLAGSAVPPGFQDIPVLSPALRARVVCWRGDPHFVSTVEIGDPLANAIQAAEAIAASLTESFLWRFPAGSACPEPDDSGRDLHR